jgi:hypothetical protein
MFEFFFFLHFCASCIQYLYVYASPQILFDAHMLSYYEAVVGLWIFKTSMPEISIIMCSNSILNPTASNKCMLL